MGIEEIGKRFALAIERECIERPRYKGGEPVREGDIFIDSAGKLQTVRKVRSTAVFGVGMEADARYFRNCELDSRDNGRGDTQSAIDCHSYWEPWQYVSEILHMTGETNPEEERQLMIDDLLRRQRELDARCE